MVFLSSAYTVTNTAHIDVSPPFTLPDVLWGSQSNKAAKLRGGGTDVKEKGHKGVNFSAEPKGEGPFFYFS